VSIGSQLHAEAKFMADLTEILKNSKVNGPLLTHLATRRSLSIFEGALGEPGPDAAEVECMLTIAARVPDHKRLAPWRFVLFEGEARGQFGEILARVCKENDPEASDARLETERTRFLRSPLVTAVISCPRGAPVPSWEQELSAGAVCLNLLHAAQALGYAGNWVTEWYAYDPKVNAALGLTASERVAGYIYTGTPQKAPVERERPDIAAISTRWRPEI
jgi:nitroreductase